MIIKKFKLTIIIAIFSVFVIQANYFLSVANSFYIPPAPYVNPKKPLPNPKQEQNKSNGELVDNTNTTSPVNNDVTANTKKTQEIFAYKEPLQVEKVFADRITVQNNLVSIKAIDYSVVDLLNIVSNKLNRKMVISSDVQEKISLQVENISLESLLHIIESVSGVSWTQVDDIIIVSTNAKLSNATFFPIRFADLKSMKENLSVFGINEKIIVNDFPRGLLISAPPMTLKRIQTVVDELDKRMPSIKVEFKVLEVNKSRERRFGISWQDAVGGYSGTRVFGLTKLYNHPGEIQQIATGIVGTAQETQGWGKILARPYIITTNGIEAHLSTGDEIPIFSKDYNGNPTVEYKKVGIELYVTPSYLDGDLLNIKAKTIVNIISGSETQQGLTVPKISSREAETVMQVHSGQTIVIGGLIKQEEIKSTVRIPILGKIPVIGSLFKSTQKSKSESEILVLITPTLIYPKIHADGSSSTEPIPHNGEFPTDKQIAARKSENNTTLNNDLDNAIVNDSLPQNSKLIKDNFIKGKKSD